MFMVFRCPNFGFPMVEYFANFVNVGMLITRSKKRLMKGKKSSVITVVIILISRGSKHQVAKAKALASIRKLSEWNAKEQDKIEGYLAEADRAAKVR